MSANKNKIIKDRCLAERWACSRELQEYIFDLERFYQECKKKVSELESSIAYMRDNNRENNERHEMGG